VEICLLVEISSTSKNARRITKEWRIGKDRLSEMIFASPEKKVLSQINEEK
jgi:hypothetical protein